jgi:hypothetical protein
MRPEVQEDLRQRVEELVGSARSKFTDWLQSYGEARFASFVPDVLRFDFQRRVLSRRQIPQFAALFRDDGPNGEILPVVVLAPDLQNLDTSYERFLETLRSTKLPLEKVSPETAQNIFIDRLAEFIAVRRAWTATNASSSVTQTIVTSNRSGDTVICCQGYFTSTAAGFGTSNPAVGVLSPGRYSFGIMNGGLHDFENILWTCPSTNVRLKKP